MLREPRPGNTQGGAMQRTRCIPRHACVVSEPSPTQLEGQIGLLMEEYRALHDDINGRITAQTTLLAFAGAGLAVFVGTKDAPGWVYALVATVVAVVATGVYLSNNFWLHRAGDRVGEIEAQVNELAQSAYGLSPGTVLLRWQSDVNTLRGPVLTLARILSRRRA